MTDQAQVHKQAHKQDAGFEVAISANDLAVRGGSRIFEGRSTAGHQEVPEVAPPRRQVDTNGIIQYDQHWYVEFFWTVFGPLACLLDCGYWKANILFEKMGGGETHYSPEATTQDVGVSGHRYQSRIEIAPYALKPAVYKVVCCLQYCFEDGTPGPIVGFHDKGLIKIFEDKRVAKSYTDENGFSVPETVEDN